MTRSFQPAQLIGPTLVALSLSEVINQDIWNTITAPLIHQSGALLFVARLSILLVHNRWKHDWTVIITIAGWFALLVGLFRLFIPDQAQIEIPAIVLSVQIIALLVGVFLTFKGCRQE